MKSRQSKNKKTRRDNANRRLLRSSWVPFDREGFIQYSTGSYYSEKRRLRDLALVQRTRNLNRFRPVSLPRIFQAPSRAFKSTRLYRPVLFGKTLIKISDKPELLGVCAKRYIRKQVLHALGITRYSGRGRAFFKRPRYNVNSEVHCG